MKEETMTELTDALRELLEAYEARYPNAEAGMDAQTAWVMRQSRAREVARSLLASQAKQAGAVQLPAGWVAVPREPTKAILRPFYNCPPDELELAWQAALCVARASLPPLPAPVEQITPENTDGVQEVPKC